MEKHPTNLLTAVRSLGKLHSRHLEKVRLQYSLTQIEITIISFLHNNPGKDTAADIVTLRMLPKGNVSQGVESLIQKSLLKRSPDDKDRRRIHLTLTEQALPIVRQVEQANQDFGAQIFHGFSPGEIALYMKMSERIIQNTNMGLERN